MTFRATPQIRTWFLLISGMLCLTGCTEPELVAEPLVVEDPEAPVTLAVRLLDDGEPVPDRKVTFFVDVSGGSSQASGVRAGQAETDSDGWARVSREDGVYGPALSEDVVEGYTVEFKPVGGRTDGPYYCPTQVTAPILCGDERCPPKPWP
jgi:hypothetical protein